MKSPTSPRDGEWLQCVLDDTDALLSDHAHCERKAALTAMTLIMRHPEQSALVDDMAALAIEEMGHFTEVHARITARGSVLAPDTGDPYAAALVREVSGTYMQRLVDRLLVSALIEARSCARLLLLGEHHPEAELAQLFSSFAEAEARHGHIFVTHARAVGPSRPIVDARLAELSAIEVRLIDEGPVRCAMH